MWRVLSLVHSASVWGYRSDLALYVNGVLIIAVVKRAEARPKQIPTSTGPKAVGAGRDSSR